MSGAALPPYILRRWDIIRVFRPDLRHPHEKYCVCICPHRNWFFYFNSDPPGRRTRDFALEVRNFQVLCLPHDVSYLNTAAIIRDLPQPELTQALQTIERQHGPLLPSLRPQVLALSKAHGLFSPTELEVVLGAEE